MLHHSSAFAKAPKHAQEFFENAASRVCVCEGTETRTGTVIGHRSLKMLHHGSAFAKAPKLQRNGDWTQELENAASRVCVCDGAETRTGI